jgi:hypothetical protein
MARLGGALGSLILVAIERAADIDLIAREATLVIAADEALVTLMWFDEFSFAGLDASSTDRCVSRVASATQDLRIVRTAVTCRILHEMSSYV